MGAANSHDSTVLESSSLPVEEPAIRQVGGGIEVKEVGMASARTDNLVLSANPLLLKSEMTAAVWRKPTNPCNLMVRRLSLAELEKKAIEAATQASLLSHKMEAAGRQSPVHTSNQMFRRLSPAEQEKEALEAVLNASIVSYYQEQRGTDVFGATPSSATSGVEDAAPILYKLEEGTWVNTGEVTRSLLQIPGFQNEAGDNNCFINSIMQAISAIPQMRDAFCNLPRELEGNPALQAVSGILRDLTAMESPPLPDNAIEGKRQLLSVRALRTALAARIDIGAAGYGETSEVFNLLVDNLGSHSPTQFTVQDSAVCTYCPDVCQLYGEPTLQNSLQVPCTALAGELDATSPVQLRDLLQEMRTDTKPCPGCRRELSIELRLMSDGPEVFSIQINAMQGSVAANVKMALRILAEAELNLGTQLRGAYDPKLGYVLRAFSVFSYCHYQVFIYLEHVGWVQCNGPTMRVVGGWVDVVKMCVDEGSQPVDAFYTAVSCASTPTSSVGCPTQQHAISAAEAKPKEQQQQQKQEQSQPLKYRKKDSWRRLRSFARKKVRKILCCGDESCIDR